MNCYTKRLFDLIISGCGLVLLSPVFLLLAVLVRINLGAPIFFIQKRPGLLGKPFFMLKFRTMIDAVQDDGTSLPDGERLTRFGQFLRSSSLDELPELWNVLKGEMSLVGPRPLLVEYLSKYTPRQMRRHEVLPGITGLAQARGRNNLSWKNKFRYDVFYVEKACLLFDLRILYETVNVVVFRKGFRSHGEPTKFGE